MNMIKTLLRSMRIPFLILTPVSIFLGLATSVAASEQVSYFDFLLVLVGAVFAHISVNTFNEYHDFRSGLDAKTTKTPFSGGSGALIENPQAIEAVFYVAITSLISTIIIGIYFTFRLGVLIFLGCDGYFDHYYLYEVVKPFSFFMFSRAGYWFWSINGYRNTRDFNRRVFNSGNLDIAGTISYGKQSSST